MSDLADVEGLSIVQEAEDEVERVERVRELDCEMRVLRASAGQDNQYLALIRLHEEFDYRFATPDRFQVKVGIELWHATIVEPFIYSSSRDYTVVLSRPTLIDGTLSTHHFDHVHDLSHPTSGERGEEDAVFHFCHLGPFNKVKIQPIQSDTTVKAYLAALQILNPEHEGEKNFESVHNSRWEEVLLGQNLRTTSTANIYEAKQPMGQNIFEESHTVWNLLETWGYKLNAQQKASFHHGMNTPLNLKIVVGGPGVGKTFIDVLDTMTRLASGQKVKTISPANVTADEYIIMLEEEIAQSNWSTLPVHSSIPVHTALLQFLARES